jgi:hypothetical protein
MKDEFEDIQRLIRLKRHEAPDEGFTEQMLTQLHRRMREDMLKKSSLELLLERITTRFESWMNPPRWAFAAAAAVLVAGGLWFYNSASSTNAAPVQVDTPPHATKDSLVGEEPKVKATQPDGKAIPTSHTGEAQPQQ